MERGFWPAAAVICSCCFQSTARAESSPTASWTAPESCPQQPAFAAQVESFLRQPLSARHDRRLEISGSVTPRADVGYVAQLRVATPRGVEQRELTHRDCAELTEAAALVVALAIDPELVVPESRLSAAAVPVTESSDSSPHEPPERSTPPAAAPPSPPSVPNVIVASPPRVGDARQPRARAGAARPLRGSVHALGLIGSGVLPGVGGGFGAQGGLGQGRFRVAVRGLYWHPRFQPLEGRSNVGIDLGAWGVGIKACGLPLGGEITLVACIGPVLGDMYGQGSGSLTATRTVHDRWSALEAELSLEVGASSGLAAALGVALGKTLEAPRFGIVRDGRAAPVFEANAWTVTGFVGVGIFR